MMVRERKEERAREVGERIALARKEADGMTQRELADLIGVTERSIAAYEAGDVIPYRFMRQLESLLNRPASWILYGTDGTDDNSETLQRVLAQQQTMAEQLQEILVYMRAQKKSR